MHYWPFFYSLSLACYFSINIFFSFSVHFNFAFILFENAFFLLLFKMYKTLKKKNSGKCLCPSICNNKSMNGLNPLIDVIAEVLNNIDNIENIQIHKYNYTLFAPANNKS